MANDLPPSTDKLSRRKKIAPASKGQDAVLFADQIVQSRGDIAATRELLKSTIKPSEGK